MNRARRAVVVAGLLVAAVTACSGAVEHAAPSTTTPPVSGPSSTTTASSPGSPTTASSTTRAPSGPVTIAFAGDIHFEAFLASRLDHPATALGSMAEVLRSADLSIVNLESAVTTHGTPQPKEFTFRAPPVAFTALRDAGVDVATMANNHALDYGPVSVPDALSAAAARSMPVIGIGRNAQQAYAPWIVKVNGQRIAFLAASAFLVPASLVPSWTAGPQHAGLAMAMPGHDARLLAAVRTVRPSADTVVVDMHWGSDDLRTCPTPWQRTLAAHLTSAGADIVVGQHTHVLQGAGYAGAAYVDYGLGNFEFYVPDGGLTAQTGVLTLTVDGGRPSEPHWTPAQIEGGVPQPLTGPAAAAARQRWSALQDCTGLSARPS